MTRRTDECEEFTGARMDEIARFITAIEFMDKLRDMAHTMHKHNRITEAYYYDLRDTLIYIDGTLLLGKQNTAALRDIRKGRM